MNARALLIVIAGLMMISIKVFNQLTSSSRDISANVDNTYLREAARNIAETGVGIGIRKVADNPTWRDGIPSMNLFDGSASVSLSDTLYNGYSCLRVVCTGTIMSGTPEEHSETAMAYLYGDTIPGVIQGAITSNHDITQKGSFEVDGRDHDDDENIVSGKGTKGIWTEGDAESDDDKKVYGSGEHESDDDHYSDTSVVIRGATWPGGMPTSPDSVMSTCGEHFSEGCLKSLAQSHSCGSQYVTNPSTLTYPLQGISYVELPDKGTWTPTNLCGSGILIVHNGGHNACMANAGGTKFTGIVMCDQVNKINCTLQGALVDMGSKKDDPADGNGQILFDRECMRSITGQAARGLSTNGSAFGAIAWR